MPPMPQHRSEFVGRSLWTIEDVTVSVLLTQEYLNRSITAFARLYHTSSNVSQLGAGRAIAAMMQIPPCCAITV